MYIYLDADFMAHPEQNAEVTLTAWEDADGFFDGKCDAFIEGYRVVPEGATWIRDDGKVFSGLMITPVVNPASLQAAQAEADQQIISDLDAAVIDLTYQNILYELGVE